MSLPHVLLGMLSQPASGYDLKNVFQQSVRHFWSAELSQIYPTLSRLEKAGLLESEHVPSSKGPPKKHYKRTEEGRRELVEWLSGGPIVRHDRTAFLTQLFFLEEIPLGLRIAFFADLHDDFVAQLAELEAVAANWAAEDPGFPHDLPPQSWPKQMTLELGLRKYALIRDWAGECRDRMQALQNERNQPAG